jgi:alpha,alpha-trehalase
VLSQGFCVHALTITLNRAIAVILSLACFAAAAQSPRSANDASIRAYIAKTWNTLSRSMSDCKSVTDPKILTESILYLPTDFPAPPALIAMKASCHVEIDRLPRAIHRIGDISPEELPVEGLLYLPNRYVVPGGRFNEMYGWDSYFIILGLIHDSQFDLARGMVENLFFEIENYGAILNANRTYYLTRSQPPLLSSMIREVYEHPAPSAQLDLKWLAGAYSDAQRDYALWMSPAHRAGKTGLARYRDSAEGPVPEMADDSSYYRDVIHWLLAHRGDHPEYLVESPKKPTPLQTAALAKASCNIAASLVCRQAVVEGHRLSATFYRGDRAMRESGFDTSFRFGPFSGSTDLYAPVCLNSLLYKYEKDMAHFASLLGRTSEANIWERRAITRKVAINRYLWDARRGLYLDYNFTTRKRSSYHFITTFYPLWAGVASRRQAAAVDAHLELFERLGGLATSDYASGMQWDLPFGWAPTTWLSVFGLDQYGYREDAARVAREFSGSVLDSFLRDGTIREKYDVIDSSSNVKVTAGYTDNVVGFGWTNAVYLKLQDILMEPAANSLQSQP